MIATARLRSLIEIVQFQRNLVKPLEQNCDHANSFKDLANIAPAMGTDPRTGKYDRLLFDPWGFNLRRVVASLRKWHSVGLTLIIATNHAPSPMTAD